MNTTQRHAICLTSAGVVSPIGVGNEAWTRSLRDGVSGVRALDFSTSGIRSCVAATCPDFDPLAVLSPADVKRLPRLVPMALAAAREALARASLDTAAIPLAARRRIGLVLGTGGGGIDFTLDQISAMNAGRTPSLWTITGATHGNLAGELSIHLGLHGPSLCISTGCASSSDALGHARDLLLSDRPGSPDAMLVVGADAHVTPETLQAMELLRVITTRPHTPDDAHTASRPFDTSRDGFVLGEGAWAVLLEREDHARRREVAPLATLDGYACTCDAYHRVRPDPDMTESIRAMHDAIEDAGLTPNQIDLIHYHGTGTQLNDRLETQATKDAFGPHAGALKGTSVKSMIGHPQGASGIAALCATLAGLAPADDGPPFIPPTINLNTPDPECDLNYTPNRAVETDARTALINCLAFGAKNSALVITRAP